MSVVSAGYTSLQNHKWVLRATSISLQIQINGIYTAVRTVGFWLSSGIVKGFLVVVVGRRVVVVEVVVTWYAGFFVVVGFDAENLYRVICCDFQLL